jgi:uncharacterized protein (DUF1015 family)
MSAIRPFRAIRYAESPSPDVSRRLAPPYDVLDVADKQRLLAADPLNFVAIDLPHCPPKAAGPPEAYASAARTLNDWQARGVLRRDSQDALYVYYQRYTHAGVSYTRKMFFAALRLEPFGTGSVFPHERTFGGPKEDRLLLTQATRCNLSPIFGLYEDRANQVATCLASAIGPQPLLHGTFDGVENQLWAVTNQDVIRDVKELMASRATYIADGHHRYGTALNYREALEKSQGALPAEHPANYTLCAFCAMEDPGLLILPTHRVLPGVRASIDLFRSDAQVEVTPLSGTQPESIVQALPKLGPQAVAVTCGPERAYYALRAKDERLLSRFEPGRSAAWRGLALAFLHAYLIDRVVGPHAGGTAPEIHYVKSADAAVDEARGAGGIAFLLQPTTMEELRAVCQANDLMPQKSTYFFPKLASGLVLHALAD